MVMYDNHYNYVMPKYPKTKLLITDTDMWFFFLIHHIKYDVTLSQNNFSFCYLMATDRDIYKDMKESNLFDFSNFKNENYYNEENKLIPGMTLIIHKLCVYV